VAPTTQQSNNFWTDDELVIIGFEIERGSEDLCPLDDVHLAKINFKQRTLADNLDPDNGLVSELWATKCINLRHREHIKAGGTYIERNRRLLDILTRRSLADFNKFIDCLGKTGQHHWASLLTDDAGSQILCGLYYNRLSMFEYPVAVNEQVIYFRNLSYTVLNAAF
jgi:hypothetical protein